jgi:hypothetical protein
LRQSTVVTAWCGAAYDEATDTMWLGLGGGHRDYAGNEIYKCAFHADAPSWQMVRKPSGAIGNLLMTEDGQDATGVYSDGRPRATHGYNKWCYVPGVGPVLSMHGAGAWQGATGKSWALFINEANGEASYTGAPSQISPPLREGRACCHDTLRNAIWIFANNTAPAMRYDIPANGGAHTGTHTSVGPAYALPSNMSACYLPAHDCILIAASGFENNSADTWRVLDCATGVMTSPAFIGRLAGGCIAGGSQLRWVPALGAACLWDNVTNTTLINKVTPGPNPRADDWTISALPVAPGNAALPSAKTPNGTYGRFAYSPRLGGFLVFNSTAGPTYFYKI